MAADSDVAETNADQARAQANLKKEERAREGAEAMLEYQASGREIRENMARLKALRLAKQAAEQVQPVSKPKVVAKASAIAKSAAKTAAKAAVKDAPAKARKRKTA